MRTKWTHEGGEQSVLFVCRERDREDEKKLRCCKWEQTEEKYKTHGSAVFRYFYVQQRSWTRNVVTPLMWNENTGCGSREGIRCSAAASSKLLISNMSDERRAEELL